MSDEVKTQLRIPAEMHETIRRLADQELRSLNAQILILLREALSRRRQGSGNDEYSEFLVNKARDAHKSREDSGNA
jgi:hypothetical protein